LRRVDGHSSLSSGNDERGRGNAAEQVTRRGARVTEDRMSKETLGNLRSRRYTLAAVRSPSVSDLGVSLAALLMALPIVLFAGCGPKRTSTGDVLQVAALTPPAPGVPGPEYRIAIGDELHIRFLYQPDNNEQLPVRPDGRISLGVTGEMEVVGLTPVELEKLIVERASNRLRDPEVTVVVTKVGDKYVYVGGEVVRPGAVILQPGMTPLQAVMQQGGFRPTAKRDSVVLITPSPDGKFQASRMNLQQVVEDGVPERVRLRPNEVVFVPKSWIGNMNEVVDLYVRGLIPALPRVGVGYSLNNQ
jgi:polysaccharide biosynthesis/export protein PslD